MIYLSTLSYISVEQEVIWVPDVKIVLISYLITTSWNQSQTKFESTVFAKKRGQGAQISAIGWKEDENFAVVLPLHLKIVKVLQLYLLEIGQPEIFLKEINSGSLKWICTLKLLITLRKPSVHGVVS